MLALSHFRSVLGRFNLSNRWATPRKSAWGTALSLIAVALLATPTQAATVTCASTDGGVALAEACVCPGGVPGPDADGSGANNHGADANCSVGQSCFKGATGAPNEDGGDAVCAGDPTPPHVPMSLPPIRMLLVVLLGLIGVLSYYRRYGTSARV